MDEEKLDKIGEKVWEMFCEENLSTEEGARVCGMVCEQVVGIHVSDFGSTVPEAIQGFIEKMFVGSNINLSAEATEKKQEILQ